MTDTANPSPAHPEVPQAVQRRSASQLSENHLTCRMMRHNWQRTAPDTSRPTGGWGTPISWKCDRCGMVRTDVIDALGDVSWRGYTRPEGYGIPADQSPRTNVLRLEYLKRLKKENLK